MKYILLASALCLSACGDQSDRPEVIKKLRGIGASTQLLGASSEQLAASPSTSDAPKKMEVTVYAGLPPGEKATIEPFVDQLSPFAITLTADQIKIIPGSEEYKTYPGLELLTFKAELAVPTVEDMQRFGGAGQVRYGFILRSGTEEEKVTGNFLVFPDGAQELSWTRPTATLNPIDAPNGVVKLHDPVGVTALTNNKNDEELKIGWFATNGEIYNRRAKSTKWEIKDAGEHTLIFTARGKRSRGFTIEILTVKAE